MAAAVVAAAVGVEPRQPEQKSDDSWMNCWHMTPHYSYRCFQTRDFDGNNWKERE